MANVTISSLSKESQLKTKNRKQLQKRMQCFFFKYDNTAELFFSGMRKIDVFEGFVSACENCVSLQTGFGLQTDLLSWEGLVDCPTQLTLIFVFFSLYQSRKCERNTAGRKKTVL